MNLSFLHFNLLFYGKILNIETALSAIGWSEKSNDPEVTNFGKTIPVDSDSPEAPQGYLRDSYVFIYMYNSSDLASSDYLLCGFQKKPLRMHGLPSSEFIAIKTD